MGSCRARSVYLTTSLLGWLSHHFSNFGRSPVPEDLCKDKAPGLIWFWRRRFLKVLPYMGMDRDYFSNLSFPQPKEAPHKI